MKHHIGWLVFPLFVVLVAAGTYASDGRAEDSAPVVRPAEGASAPDVAIEVQAKGRYKRQGDEYQWDANDTGPNQCTPQTEGRFKQEGDKCVWASNDRGPNQCTPKKGRFKKEGDKCVWNGEDSGPNQCNPRQPRS